MEFSPNNKVVKICLKGIDLEEKGRTEEAAGLFLEAWNAAADDLEKFLAAYFVARIQKDVSEKLKWFETSLQYALKTNDEASISALPALYLNISRCYVESGDSDRAKENYELAALFKDKPLDKGPFYHGTKADLLVGGLLTAGGSSNYKPEITMNHIYFTALVSGAGLAAALAKGEGSEHIYIVEPTGRFENDPNVTDKKFPGNLTRSYRSRSPLRITGELTDWTKQTPEEIQKWREKLSEIKGNIIN